MGVGSKRNAAPGGTKCNRCPSDAWVLEASLNDHLFSGIKQKLYIQISVFNTCSGGESVLNVCGVEHSVKFPGKVWCAFGRDFF